MAIAEVRYAARRLSHQHPGGSPEERTKVRQRYELELGRPQPRPLGQRLLRRAAGVISAQAEGPTRGAFCLLGDSPAAQAQCAPEASAPCGPIDGCTAND